MNTQRLLLRAMLWLLAVAAAAGVLAVFSNAYVSGRVAGTALVAAVAIALCMRVTGRLDDDKTRGGGVICLGSIVLGFVLSLAAVWIDLLGLRWDVQWRLALSALIVTVGGSLAGEMVARMSLAAVYWSTRVMIIADAITSACFLIALWMMAEDKVAASGCFVIASGVVAAIALLGTGVERRPWRWAGVAAAGAGLAIGLAGTWFVHSDDPSLYIVTMSIAFVAAHAVAVLRVPMGESRFIMLIVAIGSTATTGVLVSAVAMTTHGRIDSADDSPLRLAGAAGIVSAWSTLGIVVMYLLARKAATTSVVVTEIKCVDVACPHCGKAGKWPIGESACEGCGLLITLTVREPRCEKCDYPLLDLRGGNKGLCPECGTTREASASAP